MPKHTSSTEPYLPLGATTSAPANRTPTLASALTRGSRREIERRLEGARYHVGIDLGTTNSSVAIVDALALLEGDTDGAVQVLPVRQETEDGTVTSPFLASVVAEVGPGEWWVGRGAREARSRGLLRGRQVFYSTKSEMGLGREPFYPFASSREYDSPWKVAGRILAELREAVEAEVGPEPLERAVVTVPASFQLAARKDTFRAAGLAGLTLSEQGLLDEPNAALLDWLLTCRPRSQDGRFFDLSHPRTILVFDFGGGTCDVSVLRAHADRDEQDLRLANLSIARYEQLGGDNIDAAIVERVLLPQLLRQNGLATLDLSFSEKQERVVPQLLSTAEALKLRLPGLPRTLQVELPARAGVPLRTLNLHLPTMSAAELEAVLAPFVDAECTYSRDTEMNRVSSVFGPIRDALRRARLDERPGGRGPAGRGQRAPAAGAGGALRRSFPARSCCGSRTTRGLSPGWRAGPRFTPSSSTGWGDRSCGRSPRRAWGSSLVTTGTSSSSRGGRSCRFPRTGRRRGRAAWSCRAT